VERKEDLHKKDTLLKIERRNKKNTQLLAQSLSKANKTHLELPCFDKSMSKNVYL
jgi:hypothetical protein